MSLYRTLCVERFVLVRVYVIFFSSDFPRSIYHRPCALYGRACRNHPSVEDHITFKRHRGHSIVRPGRSSVYFIFDFFFLFSCPHPFHFVSLVLDRNSGRQKNGRDAFLRRRPNTPAVRSGRSSEAPTVTADRSYFSLCGRRVGDRPPPARFVSELLELRPAGRPTRVSRTRPCTHGSSTRSAHCFVSCTPVPGNSVHCPPRPALSSYYYRVCALLYV